MKTRNTCTRLAGTLVATAIAAGLPLSLTGCDDPGDSRVRETTTTKTETPDATVKTTETTEKKVDVDRK